jgi:feruloyl esterase
MTTAARALAATTLYFAALFPLSAAAADCESLASAALPETATIAAQAVAAGAFDPPYGNSLDKLPAFCRVTGVSKPTKDSYIRFEVWLPVSGWNSKFLGVGNGGFAGSIDYGRMARALKDGYATAGTNAGHDGEAVDATWAFGHPEKVIDFGYRALHDTTVNAKTLVSAFYGQAPRYSYFDSCSNGGREALMEAQRFPEDFNGILAGAPANNWTGLLTGGLAVTQNMYRNPPGYISGVKLAAIHKAALAACDAQDGNKDGIINNPETCHFDPSVLLCEGAESRTCLTPPQVSSLKSLYGGGRTPRGEKIFTGLVPGGEPGWAPWITGPGPGGALGPLFVENYFRYMVFEDPAWDLVSADIDTARRTANEKSGPVLNAVDPDLKRFEAQGGKLILYHGWNDAAISPMSTIDYYKSVLATMGAEKTNTFVRVYMVPGMGHCTGGPGPNVFGQLGLRTSTPGAEHSVFDSLEQWVESKTPPAAIIATKFAADSPAKDVQMTRPLCPYPQTAKYKGTGDAKSAENFECSE